jgi:hypothetical protein
VAAGKGRSGTSAKGSNRRAQGGTAKRSAAKKSAAERRAGGKAAGGGTSKRRATENGLTVLRPVGLSEDGHSVILAPRAGGKGTYRVPIDDRLVAQLVAARDLLEASPPPVVPRAGGVVPAAESKLTIKEIQALLREGRTVESIARKAGVDPTWIERFEGPIVWERDGMARRTQRSTLVRSRRGPSELPLGEAVVANLRRRRVAMTEEQIEAGWDSVKETRTGTWRVRFAFTSRGRPRVAEWRFDPETSSVAALNELANELGWLEPRRRRRSSR